MRVTCMQKKVKIESNSPQNMQKKLKNKSLQNALEVTCKQKRLNTKSNSSQMCPQVTFSVWISELIFSRAKHTSFHFHWQLQTEANFWNTGMHLKFHFHFSEIIQMSSVNTEPSQQWELFSILLWRGSWFWLFTHFGAIKSPRLRLGLFIAPKCVKSQNQLPFHTMKKHI